MAGRLYPGAGKVFIVHGESDASEALRERIQRELNWHASVPMQNQEFAL
jgi:hypothetical protein